MKEKFVKKITEAGRAIWEIKAFEFAMNAIVIVLAFAVFFTFLKINLLLSAIPGIFYLIWALLKGMLNTHIVETIERKNENLSERLRTAYDNQDNDNIITDSLLEEVSDDMEKVETASFVESDKLTIRVAASVFLMLMMLLLTLINVSIHDLGELDDFMRWLQDSMKERGIEYDRVLNGGDQWEVSNHTTKEEDEKLGAEPGGERPGFNQGPIPGGGGGIGSEENIELYGEASSATIAGEEVDLNLRPDYGGEIEINEENGGDQHINIMDAEAVESTERCDECAIGPEHEELVKRYFNKLLGEV